LNRSSKIAIISGILAVVIISVALAVHFRLSEMEKLEVETGEEQNEKESASEVVEEIVSSIQNKPESEENEDEEGNQTMTPSYVKIVDGVQVVTINAKEFTFTPSEIHIKAGKTKFVMVNNGVAEHELVAYEASKKEIVDKAELAEDEDTIEKNILFEIEEVLAGESGESEVIDLREGSYVIGCHVPGHYEAGMHGTIEIEA
jgi:uncharacterized cupredoxin-like copper-binding protein